MIVFATTCKGRAQHIEKTLPKNLEDNRDFKDLKFLILNYNSPDHLLDYLVTNHKPEMKSGRIVVYSSGEVGPFKMAHSKNMAHRLGIMEGADVLVNVDADNYTGQGFAGYVADKLQDDNTFLWSRMVQGQLKRGVSGRIALSSKAFMAVGGYDEQFNTWGPDDKDINVRLQRLGYTACEVENQYLDAIHHKDKLRFKEYPHARPAPGVGEDEFYLMTDATVVNYGNFGCGTVLRNFDPTPVELCPIPTRIFGVGLHKTATTSLHRALEILGYDSAHWKSGNWARTIWKEMTIEGRSRTLEKHYCLSDLPIALLYEKLDKAYPGSKFILTVRDEQKWLRSVRNHWSYESNEFRWEWDVYPFPNKIHRHLYGQTDFNEEVFLNRYRRHNEEVKQYFKGTNKLLVMDMDSGSGWNDLCSFLGRPIPSVDYPRQFATKGITNVD